jgi:hypothetical protein
VSRKLVEDDVVLVRKKARDLAQEIAEHLLSRFARATDDALVLVAR